LVGIPLPVSVQLSFEMDGNGGIIRIVVLLTGIKAFFGGSLSPGFSLFAFVRWLLPVFY